MEKTSQKVRVEGVITEDIVITIERTPTQAAIYSDEPGITVIRDAHVSNRDLLVAYADSLEEMQRLEPAPTA